MSKQHLARMANDIADFFAAEPDHDTAVAGIVDHIHRFWDPRMRRQLSEYLLAGGEDLKPLARAAAQQLQQQASPQS